jgi:hypothetical protein
LARTSSLARRQRTIPSPHRRCCSSLDRRNCLHSSASLAGKRGRRSLQSRCFLRDRPFRHTR